MGSTKMSRHRREEYEVVYHEEWLDGNICTFYSVESVITGLESTWIMQTDAQERAQELNRRRLPQENKNS